MLLARSTSTSHTFDLRNNNNMYTCLIKFDWLTEIDNELLFPSKALSLVLLSRLATLSEYIERKIGSLRPHGSSQGVSSCINTIRAKREKWKWQVTMTTVRFPDFFIINLYTIPWSAHADSFINHRGYALSSSCSWPDGHWQRISILLEIVCHFRFMRFVPLYGGGDLWLHCLTLF